MPTTSSRDKIICSPQKLPKSNETYTCDISLKYNPPKWNMEQPHVETKKLHRPPVNYPRIEVFMTLSLAVFLNDPNEGPSDLIPKAKGFKILTQATNTSPTNGYCGAAYINRKSRQIIVSHRGYVLNNAGSVYTEKNGVLGNSVVPQVTSAMTFAYEIQRYAEQYKFELFFTGIDVGAWLAKITTFSLIYLTKDLMSNSFVHNIQYTSANYNYTVVFDSPGAYFILQKIKDDLFPLHEPLSQEINVLTLPVEVYQFFPSTIKDSRRTVGSLFKYDLNNAEGLFGSGALTLKRKPTFTPYTSNSTLSPYSSEWSVKARIRSSSLILWNNSAFKKKEMLWIKCGFERRNYSESKNSLPAYFFNREERSFLEGLAQTNICDRRFQGNNTVDQHLANSLLKRANGNLLWKLTECSQIECVYWDRRKFLPLVRHTVRCLSWKTLLWKQDSASSFLSHTHDLNADELSTTLLNDSNYLTSQVNSSMNSSPKVHFVRRPLHKIAEENLSALLEITKLTLETCTRLYQFKILTLSQFDSLKANMGMQGAVKLYTEALRNISGNQELEKKFLEALSLGGCAAAVQKFQSCQLESSVLRG